MPIAVLDASALLAYLRDEPGAGVVARAISEGAAISAVNLAEVLARASDRGGDAQELAGELSRRGLLGGAVAVEPFTAADAVEAARLRPGTRHLGLSLGDRACLALAMRVDAPALTADGSWTESTLDVEVQQIR